MTQANNTIYIPHSDQTIVALATPPGRAGVAVVRLSGSLSLPLLSYLGISTPPVPRHATLSSLRHSDGSLIDRALLLFFPGPYSFTGEDVVELHLHGSRAIVREVIAMLTARPGCRMAEPGEFSRRAFLNGKMDLLEAEGLADLIDAETASQHRQALRQMSGSSGQLLEAFRTRIIHAMALIEAYIDFPDEDIPPTIVAEMTALVNSVTQDMENAICDDGVGEKIRDGISCIILGAPNAGKSSLLNALAKRDVAIVSDIAGTTRDLIEVDLELHGYALRLIDTAGLRETGDRIEQEGIVRAKARADQADYKLILFDAAELPTLDSSSYEQLDNDSLVVITKCDLSPSPVIPDSLLPYQPLILSTQTGEGLDDLIRALTDILDNNFAHREPPLITRLRHRHELQSALFHLHAFSPTLPIEFQAEELRLAAQHIGKITGKISVDDILDAVFSQFCIGK